MNKKNKNITPWFKPRMQQFLVIAVAVLIYSNTLGHQFALDDKAVISENVFTQKGFQGIKDLVTHDHFYGYNNALSGLYRPVPLITHAVEVGLFGISPFVGHLVNLLLYALSCMLLLSLLNKLFGKDKPLLPLIATLLYVVHPVHTELVANIKGRDDILNSIFLFSSLICVFNYSRSFKLSHYALALFFFTLALFTKESAATFIAVIPLFLYFFSDIKIKRIAVLTLPLILCVGLYLYVRSLYIDSSAEYRFLDSYFQYAPSRSDRLATGIANVLNYLGLSLFPHPLIYDYSYHHFNLLSWLHPKTWISLLLIISSFIPVFLFFKKKNNIAFFILFFWATIALSVNVLTPNQAIFAVRYLYLPSVAVAVLLSMAFLYITEKMKNKHLALSLFMITFIGFSIKTFSRNSDWKDDKTLFSNDLVNASRNARAHMNLARIHAKNYLEVNGGKTTENYNKAMALLDETVRIDPGYYEAHFLAGALHFQQGKYPQSIQSFSSALKIDSNYLHAQYTAENAMYFIALSYTNLQNYAEAIHTYQSFIRYKPSNRPKNESYLSSVYNNLGYLHNQLGKYAEAIPFLETAIKLDPSNNLAYGNIELACNMLKQYDQVLQFLEDIKNTSKNQFLVVKTIGIFYFHKMEYAKAIAVFQELIKNYKNDPVVFHYLGNALLGQGKLQDAIVSFKEAVRLNPEFASYYKNILK